MADMNLRVVIPASGKARLSDFLPTRTGGTGNLLASAPGAPFSDAGDIYMQNAAFQNQGGANMAIGDASTTLNNGFILTPFGSFTATGYINYATYISDWYVAGTPGQVLFLLYNK